MASSLDTYRTLGRSGLRVSRLALGTATFGTDWGWGADEADSRAIFERYREEGGNFIDTAATYTNGSSERLLGKFIHDARDSVVLASKYSTLRRPGDPNSGGSSRKNLFASVQESLRRLGTDYLDLLYLHVWDELTPVDEIMQGLDDLVRQGKVLYVAISTAPAWQISRMQTLADMRGWTPLVALQIEYNLIERGGESDLIPMAHAMGLGVVPFSPLAGGVLTGKYSRADVAAPQGGTPDGTRKNFNMAMGTLTERNLGIVDVVSDIATEVGRTAAQVGLAWNLASPHVTAPIIGARTIKQLEENLEALTLDLSPTQIQRLDEVSAIEPGFPHALLASDHIRRETRGDMVFDVQGRR